MPKRSWSLSIGRSGRGLISRITDDYHSEKRLVFSWAGRDEDTKKTQHKDATFRWGPAPGASAAVVDGLRAWAQFLLDLVFFEDDVVGQAVFGRDFRFADDQRGGVLNELIVW
jgi:hypothetical protein